MSKLQQFKPASVNANKHTVRGLKALEQSIREDGYVAPITVAADGESLDGSARMEVVADILDAEPLVVHHDGTRPVIMMRDDIPSADSDIGRRVSIRANRVAALDLEWNPDVLLTMPDALIESLWNPEELSALGDAWAQQQVPVDAPDGQLDRAEELQAEWQVKPGDIWQAGEHAFICGDCREPETWAKLLVAAGVDKANGVFTSPPYAEQRKEQYGGTPADKYVDWWEAVQANVKAFLASDGSFFVNIKPHCEDGERSLYVADLVIAMRRRWGWAFIDEYCWLRTGVPKMVKYRFKNGFEPVYWFAIDAHGFKFRPDDVRHFSENVPVPFGPGAGNTNWAGKQGKKTWHSGGNTSKAQGSVDVFGGQEIKEGMAYPSNVLKAHNNNEALGHEAAFPIELPEFFVKAYSDPADVWLDPFLGSGTTIVAAHQNKRRGLGIEMLPKYGAVICQRLKDMGLTPVLLENGRNE